MKAYIENEDKLIDASHEKKILSALNRLEKAAKDITKLGYSLYLANGNLNVMNQEEYSYQLDYSQDCIVSSIPLDKTDGGDW